MLSKWWFKFAFGEDLLRVSWTISWLDLLVVQDSWKCGSRDGAWRVHCSGAVCWGWCEVSKVPLVSLISTLWLQIGWMAWAPLRTYSETQKLCVLHAGNSCRWKWREVPAGHAEGRTVQRELQSGQPEGGTEEAGGQWRGERGHRHRGGRHFPGCSPQVRGEVFPKCAQAGALWDLSGSLPLLALLLFCLRCSLLCRHWHQWQQLSGGVERTRSRGENQEMLKYSNNKISHWKISKKWLQTL